MRPSVDIQQSIAKMTIDLHRAIQSRKHEGDAFRLREREFQAQFEFHGKLGTLPVETDITVHFDVMYLYDAGNMRDNQNDRPHARLSIEMLLRPAGAIAYAHVSRWLYDNDFNYVGAVVTVGVHCPAMYVGGEMPTSFDFHGILHAAFQGYGAPMDPEDQDGEGTQDQLEDIGVG